MYVHTHTHTFGYHPSAFPRQSHETLTQPSSQGNNIHTYVQCNYTHDTYTLHVHVYGRVCGALV